MLRWKKRETSIVHVLFEVQKMMTHLFQGNICPLIIIHYFTRYINQNLYRFLIKNY